MLGVSTMHTQETVELEIEILFGNTLSVLETHTLYNGIYFLKVSCEEQQKSYKIIINK